MEQSDGGLNVVVKGPKLAEAAVMFDGCAFLVERNAGKKSDGRPNGKDKEKP